jgi:hypothetical protein
MCREFIFEVYILPLRSLYTQSLTAYALPVFEQERLHCVLDLDKTLLVSVRADLASPSQKHAAVKMNESFMSTVASAARAGMLPSFSAAVPGTTSSLTIALTAAAQHSGLIEAPHVSAETAARSLETLPTSSALPVSLMANDVELLLILRPGLCEFLKLLSTCYDFSFCTMGTREYATEIYRVLKALYPDLPWFDVIAHILLYLLDSHSKFTCNFSIAFAGIVVGKLCLRITREFTRIVVEAASTSA